MAKVQLREINKALNEHNLIENDLSFDEQCRELDAYEENANWNEWLYPEHNEDEYSWGDYDDDSYYADSSLDWLDWDDM